MSFQSCRLMVRSCSNPVHIAHQYWRKDRHAGVRQWPLWENHAVHSFHPRKSSDQWRGSPSQCWKLRKLEFGRHLRPCCGKSLICWCCCVIATQESCLYQKSRCLFWFRARMSRALKNFFRAGRTSTGASSMSCQSCQLMWRSCSNPVHIDHQYWRKDRHAGGSQWPWWENHSLPSFHPRRRSDQWRVSPSQCAELKKLEFGRHLKPCFWEEPYLLMLLCDRHAGILSLSEIALPVLVSSKDEQTLNKSCRAGRTSTCASSMYCQSCQLMWRSCSNPVHIPVLKKGQTCRCQPVTTVREPSSSQFPSSSKVAMLDGTI